MTYKSRKDIPDPVKREVRKRCGYGCVLCGLPLYEYDHIDQYNIVLEHKAENLTLLCDLHHSEKTRGILPVDIVKKANDSPYNLKKGYSSPYKLHVGNSDFSLEIANNNIAYSAPELNENIQLFPLVIDDVPIIWINIIDGILHLNISIFDKDNKHILFIENNELIYSISPWDIDFVSNRIIIREKSRDILIEVEINEPHIIKFTRGKIFLNGIGLLLDRNNITDLNSKKSISMSGNKFWNNQVAISAGDCKKLIGLHLHLVRSPNFPSKNLILK